MTINGLALMLAAIVGAIIGWCSYWAGRNDEREMWERQRRRDEGTW